MGFEVGAVELYLYLKLVKLLKSSISGVLQRIEIDARKTAETMKMSLIYRLGSLSRRLERVGD
jgi:hypothetical protein